VGGLPGIDGYEVARRAKETDPAACLVALTGYGQPEDRRRAVDAGFDSHLVKPVHPDALLAVIASVCPAQDEAPDVSSAGAP
jgi:CheY-like chemotaxis protein